MNDKTKHTALPWGLAKSSPAFTMCDDDAHKADLDLLKRANLLLRNALESSRWHWDSKNNEFYCAFCRVGKGHGHSPACIIRVVLEEGK